MLLLQQTTAKSKLNLSLEAFIKCFIKNHCALNILNPSITLLNVGFCQELIIKTAAYVAMYGFAGSLFGSNIKGLEGCSRKIKNTEGSVRMF